MQTFYFNPKLKEICRKYSKLEASTDKMLETIVGILDFIALK